MSKIIVSTVVLSCMIASCQKKSNSRSDLKQEQFQTKKTDVSAETVAVSIDCRASNGATLSLDLLLNSEMFTKFQSAVMTGSFVGALSQSPMLKEHDNLKKIEIRSKELAEISACLDSQQQKRKIASLGINIPKLESFSTKGTAVSPGPGKELVDLSAIRQQLAELRSALKDQNWAASHVKMANLNGLITVLKQYPLVDRGVRDPLVNEFEHLKSTYVENGLMKCVDGHIPLLIVSEPNSSHGKKVRHLANLSCYPEKLGFQASYLAHLFLLDQIFEGQVADLFPDFMAASSPNDLKMIWQKITLKSAESGKLMALRSAFAKVYEQSLGDTEQQKIAFARFAMKQQLGDGFMPQNQEMTENIASLLSSMI